MSRECQICCGSSKMTYSCLSCGYLSCRACCRRIAQDRSAACASCDAPWSVRECQTRMGTDHYRNVYRKSVRRQLLIRELSRMHHAHPFANRERQRRFLRSEIRRLTIEVRDNQRWDLVPDLRVAQTTMRILMTSNTVSEGAVAQPIMRCPHDGCDGIVDESSTCVACRKQVCRTCGCPAHPDRECFQEDVQSMTVIRLTSRPCVNCGVPSVRVEGCAVMWCSHCHVFWHWDRRKIIETRGNMVPHNPDHRDWIATERGRMREVQDLPCGGFPDTSRIHNILISDLHELGYVLYTDVPVLLSAIESLQHAQMVLRPRYPRVTTDDALFQLRVDYLLGRFKNDDEYSERIETYERIASMKREIGVILETFVMSGLDVIQRFADQGPDHDPVSVVVQSLFALHRIVNDSLDACSKMWGRKAPSLTEDWKWRVPYTRRT